MITCTVCGKETSFDGCTKPGGFGAYANEIVCHECLAWAEDEFCDAMYRNDTSSISNDSITGELRNRIHIYVRVARNLISW